MQDTREYMNISGFLGFIYMNYAQVDHLYNRSEIILFATQKNHYSVALHRPSAAQWLTD